MFPLLIFSLSLPPYIFPPSPSFFPFSLLSWTCKTLASASGMLVFQPCATIPTSEVCLSCPLCPKTVHWVLSLSLYHCSKKKNYVCTYMYTHVYVCVLIWVCSMCIHYDWGQQWFNWVVSMPTLLSLLHVVIHICCFESSVYYLQMEILFDFSLRSAGRL